jgi:hypothetical protein
MPSQCSEARRAVISLCQTRDSVQSIRLVQPEAIVLTWKPLTIGYVSVATATTT